MLEGFRFYRVLTHLSPRHQDEKPSWADDIDTAYAEDEDDGGEEYGDTEDYTGEEAYAPTGAEDVEGDEDMEEAPLNMVSSVFVNWMTGIDAHGIISRTPISSRLTMPLLSENNAKRRKTRRRTKARAKNEPSIRMKTL
jgi:hypothetical protein